MDRLLNKPIKGQKEADQFLTYLNNQPDMLTAILKHRTSFAGQTGNIWILPLPRTLDKMVLAVHPPPSGEMKEIEVPFEPPMADFREFRSRLIGWRDEAFKRYNVPKTPTVSYYQPPPLFPLTLPLVLGIVAVLFASYGSGTLADWFRGKIIDTFGPGMIPGARWFAIIMHVLEAGYMAYACVQHQVPFMASLKWVAATLVTGFPAINELWESIQYERLRVIYRQTDVGDIGPRLPDPVVKGSAVSDSLKATSSGKKEL